MIISIHQPNFIPWLGYFHKLVKSDYFVLFDDVQFPMGKSFCNRVAIKIGDESRWLTVPVKGKSQLASIKDILIAEDQPWRRKHLKTLQLAYEKTPYFDLYYEDIKNLYQHKTLYLVEFNKSFIQLIKEKLGSPTRIICSSELGLGNLTGTEHILAILKTLGGDKYLTGEGKGSRRYLDSNLFEEKGVNIIYQQFEHPVYQQRGDGFIPNLSILDLLFNHGPRAKEILLGINGGQ